MLSPGKIFATVAHDVVVGAKAVEKWLTKQGQSVPAIDARVASIESLSKRLLGDALQAVVDGGEAAAQHGVNIAVDVATVADVKQLAIDLKDELAAFGVKI